MSNSKRLSFAAYWVWRIHLMLAFFIFRLWEGSEHPDTKLWSIVDCSYFSRRNIIVDLCDSVLRRIVTSKFLRQELFLVFKLSFKWKLKWIGVFNSESFVCVFWNEMSWQEKIKLMKARQCFKFQLNIVLCILCYCWKVWDKGEKTYWFYLSCLASEYFCWEKNGEVCMYSRVLVQW